MNKIIPHLWYDKEAGEASDFYVSLFDDSKIISKTVIKDTPSGDAEFLTIQLAGQKFMLISAGPYFKFNPSVSFLYYARSEAEVESLANSLLEGGAALMPLDTYDFSPKYAWVMDRYGLSWQIMLPPKEMVIEGARIIPTLMFVGENCGRAKEAVDFYTQVFKNSSTDYVDYYGENPGPDAPDHVKHAGFKLEGEAFAIMDSAYEHQFAFNEAVSFLVNCHGQEEIDYYWDALSAVSEAEQCGWLKDRYGLSWQIAPDNMDQLMNDSNPERMAKVTEAFLQMKKFDLATLEEIYNRY